MAGGSGDAGWCEDLSATTRLLNEAMSKTADDWDLEDDDCPLPPGEPRRVWGGLTCTRGTKGIIGLSLPPTIATEAAALAETMKTMSATDAVHGRDITWVRGEVIGRGNMGTVCRALNQSTGEVIVVKEVSFNAERESDLNLRAALENELEICKTLRHRRIVSFLGYDHIDGNLYIYLEYMAGGSLSHVLQQFGMLEESLIQVYTREVVEGLEYLHAQVPPVLHRDIKGANILVGIDCKVKLADFGCSKREDEDMAFTMRGSVPWMAPEVIMRTGYGKKADIWSLGCVVIEMATASPPWGRLDNPIAAMRLIGMSDQLPAVPASLSPAAQEFVAMSVQRDKEKRFSAGEALQHAFLVGDPLEVLDL